MNVVVAKHICEIQLHLRSFYCLKDGQHEVYQWSRTLGVTANMRAEHLFKDIEPGILELMIQLARKNWFSTGGALVSLLHEAGKYKKARNLQRQVSTHSAF